MPADRHVGAGRRRLDRVVHQMVQRPLHQPHIPVRPRLGVASDDEIDRAAAARLLTGGLSTGNHPLDQLGDAEFAPLHGAQALVHGDDVQRPVDQAQQALAALQDGLGVQQQIGARQVRRLQHHLGQADHRDQRRAQFVGDHRQQVTARPLAGAARLHRVGGDDRGFVQPRQQPGALVLGGADLRLQLVVARRPLPALQRAGAGARDHVGDHAQVERLLHHVEDMRAQRPQHGLGGGVAGQQHHFHRLLLGPPAQHVSGQAEPVLPGHADIRQDDQDVRHRRQHRLGLFGRVGGRRSKAALAQATGEQVGDGGLVVHDQHPPDRWTGRYRLGVGTGWSVRHGGATHAHLPGSCRAAER